MLKIVMEAACGTYLVMALLKQYSTLCSGTATPTHLLGGVHRGDDSSSWLRAVILGQRYPLFIYNKECDV